jgi:protein O-mannosyl-transferase
MEHTSTQNHSSPGRSLRERRIVLVVLFVTAITYMGTLRFDFVYDDGPQALHNPFIQAWRYVPQYFVSSVWKQVFPFAPGNYYRPLFLLWLRVNYAMFGARSVGWHLSTVLLHVLVTWLVYRLIMKLTGRFTVAWLSALIFGVHPIHHEVVAWISGATESLFAVMFLAAFLAYLKSLEGSKAIWTTVYCLCYGLALLGKETAIVLPAVIFAHAWLSGSPDDLQDSPATGKRLHHALIPAAFCVPIAVIYLFARSNALSGLGHAVTALSIPTWLLTLPSILLFYVKNWFFPIHLSEFYDIPYQAGLSLTGVILPVLILAAIAAAAWKFRSALGARAMGDAAIWLVIPLIPALNTFVFLPGELAHDRYFYVPSIGASLLVALVITRVMAGQREVFGQPVRVIGAALVLAVVLGLCAVQQSSFWLDDYTLFSRAHQIAPRNATALNNLGGEMLSRRELESGRALLETGYREYPKDSRFVMNLGRLSYSMKQYPKSEAYARQAINLNPNEGDSFILLAQSLLKQNDVRGATQSLRRAVEVNPYNATYHTSYGIVLELNGDCTGAIAQFESALVLHPGDGITQREMFRCRSAAAAAGKRGSPAKP